MVDYNPTALYRHRVEHDIEMDGTEVFTLDYIQGRDEARVEVRRDEQGDLAIDVQEVWDDSQMDELALHHESRKFVEEYGDGLGQVDA